MKNQKAIVHNSGSLSPIEAMHMELSAWDSLQSCEAHECLIKASKNISLFHCDPSKQNLFTKFRVRFDSSRGAFQFHHSGMDSTISIELQ